MIRKNLVKHCYLKKKKDLYSRFNMERVCKDFEMKDLGEYHNLFVQSDILLLADLFEKFRNMCLEVYELDPANFLSALG